MKAALVLTSCAAFIFSCGEDPPRVPPVEASSVSVGYQGDTEALPDSFSTDGTLDGSIGGCAGPNAGCGNAYCWPDCKPPVPGGKPLQ